jgi:hypothetical protein
LRRIVVQKLHRSFQNRSLRFALAGALALIVSACAGGPSYRAAMPRPFHIIQADAHGEAITGPPRIIPAPPMECVPFARLRSGIEVWGDAHLWWQAASAAGYVETSQPVAGDVIVIRIGEAGNRGHVAYVKRVASSREIYVDHANWHGRQEVAVDVPVIDVSPNNDWSQVRVFWVDSGQMGARTYSAEGFIRGHGTFTPGA